MAQALSADQVDHFALHGWIQLPGLLSHGWVHEVRAELAACRGATGKLDDLWVASDAVRQVATAPAVCAVLSQLYGARPIPFQTLNFVRGSEQALHADDVHFDTLPSGRMCGVWVALEDVGDDQGPLVVVPGSHRWDALRPASVLSSIRPFRYEAYEELVHASTAGHPVRRLTASAGDAIVWQAGLVHGGASVLSAGATRWSQVTHYVMSGAAYVTPMHAPSTPGAVALREPLVDIGDGSRVTHLVDGRPARVVRLGGGATMLLDGASSAPPIGLRLASAGRGALAGARFRVARLRHRRRCRQLLRN